MIHEHDKPSHEDTETDPSTFDPTQNHYILSQLTQSTGTYRKQAEPAHVSWLQAAFGWLRSDR
jgi:hypothetical protein